MSIGEAAVPSTGVSLTIHDVAAQLGHLRWLELELFRALGGAVTATTDARSKLAASVESRHAGERAEALAVVIPFIEGLTAADRTRCHEHDAAAVASAVAGTGAESRVAEARRALRPLIRAAYESILAGTGPVADAPVRRVLVAGLAGVDQDVNPC